ncbi:MAG: hypothetical protein ACOY0T_07475 [Myxococcota bacterium]
MRLWLFTLLTSFAATHSARAEWLPGASHAISTADSASPDAPVSSIGFGPRARASLGFDRALLLLAGESNLRVGVQALVAVQDADAKRALPADFGRLAFDIGAAWSFESWSRRTLGANKLLELSLGFGRRSTFAMQGYVLPDTYRSDDVPFGAGGWYFGSDVALRARVARNFQVTTRIGARLFTNAFPDLIGASEASDVVADQLREGAKLQTHFELAARFTACTQIQPFASLYADVISPHDDSAKSLWLGRLLLGLGFPGRAGELAPFFDFEAGHGQGLLVNRNQIRVGGGIRWHAP